MRLLKAYSKERLEAASRRALELRACSYQSLQSILKHSLDQHMIREAEEQLDLQAIHRSEPTGLYFVAPV